MIGNNRFPEYLKSPRRPNSSARLLASWVDDKSKIADSVVIYVVDKESIVT